MMREKRMISDDQVVKRANAAVRLELEKRKARNQPIAVFDRKAQKVYMQDSDGTIIESSERLRRGRYSERKRNRT
ncbi:hypothetical protein AAK943_12590 [Emergencia timonensis]|nr:hypothetical protein [Emergencia timonensis]SCJ90927.1 Uncharacterised protein [uncultured Eubacterium sp.]MCB6477313.1 hypothetical protein [Emergencia timonensis]WNX87796.1 hypothetical protein RVY71_16495 [Emergencia timonensis]BDF09621.1 hypothetical protein CE91St48_30620 [Emergencia timonensis]BDF13706.1 hypothetical protein CE91St49_30530 [Emergencia timonensis]